MRNENGARSANVSPAYRRRQSAVVMLTLTLVLLACVQGMLMMFAAKDRARVAQIRELTRKISEERLERESAGEEDPMRYHRSAPARAPLAAVPEAGAPGGGPAGGLAAGAEEEGTSVGSRKAGLRNLVDLANFMAHERRASLVEWRGRLAILYEKIDPSANDPIWQILNVLTELKLLDGVTVVSAESDAAKASELRLALLEFGIPRERLRLGRKAEHGEVFTGVLISTNAGP